MGFSEKGFYTSYTRGHAIHTLVWLVISLAARPSAVEAGPIAQRGNGLHARAKQLPPAGGVGASGAPSGSVARETVRRGRGACTARFAVSVR